MHPTKPATTRTDTQESTAGIDLPLVRAAVAPVLAAHGVELVDLAWQTDRMGWVLRITIEREGAATTPPTPSMLAGVTLEDCAEVSRDASAVLDAGDLIPHSYHLEVSSPGVDRPLRTAADFARFAGSTAKVKLRRPAPDGQRVLRGSIEQAPEGAVAVRVDGKRIEVPFADVAEANLVFELGKEPKKAHPKKGARAGRTSPASAASPGERSKTKSP